MSTPNPRTLPVAVVKKIQEVISYTRERYPDRDEKKPIMITSTLEIDPVTGKLNDIHLIAKWDKTPDGYVPRYATIRQKTSDGCTIFGMAKCPDDPDVHTE